MLELVSRRLIHILSRHRSWLSCPLLSASTSTASAPGYGDSSERAEFDHAARRRSARRLRRRGGGGGCRVARRRLHLFSDGDARRKVGSRGRGLSRGRGRGWCRSCRCRLLEADARRESGRGGAAVDDGSGRLRCPVHRDPGREVGTLLLLLLLRLRRSMLLGLLGPRLHVGLRGPRLHLRVRRPRLQLRWSGRSRGALDVDPGRQVRRRCSGGGGLRPVHDLRLHVLRRQR